MTGIVPERRRAAITIAAVAVPLIAAFALSACTASNTYGTGTSPGMQTLEDITGITMITGKKKDAIDYAPRPGLVAPPSTADLPPPQTDTVTATTPDWPNDPDAAHAQALATAGQSAPQQYWVKPKDTSTAAGNGVVGGDLTPDQLAAAKKAFAEARGNLAVDANGNPIRKYLTDPPVEYRAPDPTAPITTADIKKKKKKFLWWTVDD